MSTAVDGAWPARARYRARQFWHALSARPLAAAAWADIGATLTPGEVVLFRRFSRSDRRHAYRVWQLLHGRGERAPALLAAGLLHDVGKTRAPLRIWERVLLVLAEAVAPARAAGWGAVAGGRWRRPFVVRALHAEWGAALAAAAGSDPLVVALIAHHQTKDPSAWPEDAALRALLPRLQWADDQS